MIVLSSSQNTCLFQFLKELLSIWIISINKFYYKLRLTLVFVWLNSNFVPYLRVWLKNLVSFLVDYKVALFQCTFCEKLRRTFRLLQFFQIVGHTKLFKPKNLKKKKLIRVDYLLQAGAELGEAQLNWDLAEQILKWYEQILNKLWAFHKQDMKNFWTGWEQIMKASWKRRNYLWWTISAVNKLWTSHEQIMNN